MTMLPDGISMVRPAFFSTGLAFGPNGHLSNPNKLGGTQFSRDGGKQWSEVAPLVLAKDYQLCLVRMVHALRDGRVVAVAGMTRSNITKALAPANMQKFMFVGELHTSGLTWSDPIPLMTIDEGVCEESDFVELPDGNLFFMHRVQHYNAVGNYSSQDYRQSLVVKHGSTFVPQRFGVLGFGQEFTLENAIGLDNVSWVEALP
jgi:hypothetical protein